MPIFFSSHQKQISYETGLKNIVDYEKTIELRQYLLIREKRRGAESKT